MADVTISQLTTGTPSKNTAVIPYSDGTTTLKTSPSGIVAASPGCILQVKQIVKDDIWTTTNNVPNFTDITGLSISITPTSTQSKILVTANVLGSCNNNSFIRLMRNINGGAFTQIYTNSLASPGNRTKVSMGDFFMVGSPGSGAGQQNTSLFLDSPNTTDPVIYKLQGCTRQSSTFVINSTYYDANAEYQIIGASSITLMEVAG